MTRDEFDNQAFGSGDKFKYEDEVVEIVAINFTEGLFGIDYYSDRECLSWVRCESGEFISYEKGLEK